MCRASRWARYATAAWPRLGPLIALGAWVCVPVALSYAASQPRLNLHLFSWGYLIVVVPALCLLAGISIAAIRRPLARRAVATSLVAAAALATPSRVGSISSSRRRI